MQISVITSSSQRQLKELMSAVRLHSPGTAFDLFFLRQTDIDELNEGLPPEERPRTAFQLWRRPQKPPLRAAAESFCSNHFEWMSRTELGLGAFATYFPGLSSMDDDAFKTAVHGVADAVFIAQSAWRMGLMSFPIVEVVCGIVSERCHLACCRGGRNVAVFSDDAKQDRLIEGLERVVDKVARASRLAGKTNSFLIGLELEPGAGYVLRDKQTLEQIMNRVWKSDVLKEHVGLNLDVGHARIAGIRDVDLAPYESSIVHSHISDHPGMHTRDHALGAWTDIAHPNEFDPYIKLLKRRVLGESANGDGPPLGYSDTIAIELEGCNRLEWVLQSIQELKRLLIRNGIESCTRNPVAQFSASQTS